MADTTSLLGQLVDISQHHFELHKSGGAQEPKCVKIMTHVRRVLPNLEERYLNPSQSHEEVAKMLHLLELLLGGKVCNRSTEDLFERGSLSATLPRVVRLFKLLVHPAMKDLRGEISTVLESCLRLQYQIGIPEANRCRELLATDAMTLLHDVLVTGVCMARGNSVVSGEGVSIRLFPSCAAKLQGKRLPESTAKSEPQNLVVLTSQSDQLRTLAASLRLLLSLINVQTSRTSLTRLAFVQGTVSMLPAVLKHLSWHVDMVLNSHLEESAAEGADCVEKVLMMILSITQTVHISAFRRHEILIGVSSLFSEVCNSVGGLQMEAVSSKDASGSLRRVSKPVLSESQRRRSQIRKQISERIQGFLSGPIVSVVAEVCRQSLSESSRNRSRMTLVLCEIISRTAMSSKSLHARAWEGPLLSFAAVLGWHVCHLMPPATENCIFGAIHLEVLDLVGSLHVEHAGELSSEVAKVALRPCAYGIMSEANLGVIRVMVTPELPGFDGTELVVERSPTSATPSFRAGIGTFEHTGAKDGLPPAVISKLEKIGRFYVKLGSLSSSEVVPLDDDPVLYSATVMLTGMLLGDAPIALEDPQQRPNCVNGMIPPISISSFFFRMFANFAVNHSLGRNMTTDLEAILDMCLVCVLRIDGLTHGFRTEAEFVEAICALVSWGARLVSQDISRSQRKQLSNVQLRAAHPTGTDAVSVLEEPFCVKLALLALVCRAVGLEATFTLPTRIEISVLHSGLSGISVGCLCSGMGVGFTETLDTFLPRTTAQAMETVAMTVAALTTLMARGNSASQKTIRNSDEGIAVTAGRTSPWYDFLQKLSLLVRKKGKSLSIASQNLRRICSCVRERGRECPFAALLLDEVWGTIATGESLAELSRFVVSEKRLAAFPLVRKHLLGANRTTLNASVASVEDVHTLGALCRALRMDMKDEDPGNAMGPVRHYCSAFQGLLQAWFLQNPKTCHVAYDLLRGEFRDLNSAFFFSASYSPGLLLPALLEPMLVKGVVHIFAEHVADIETPTLFLALVLPYVLPPLVLVDLRKRRRPVSGDVSTSSSSSSFLETFANLALQECTAARNALRTRSTVSASETSVSNSVVTAMVFNPQEKRLLDCLNRPESGLGMNPAEDNFMAQRANDDMQPDPSVMRFLLLSEFAPNIIAHCLFSVENSSNDAEDHREVEDVTQLISAFLEMMKTAVGQQAKDANIHDLLEMYQASALRILVAALGFESTQTSRALKALELLATVSEEDKSSDVQDDGGKRRGVHNFFAPVRRKRRKLSETGSTPTGSARLLVELMMSQHWLYVMNSLITNDWRSRTPHMRRSLMISLREGMQLLGVDSLTRFAPKIIGSCSTALEDNQDSVCKAAVAVIDILVDRLSSDAIVPFVGLVSIPIFALLLRAREDCIDVDSGSSRAGLAVLSKLFRKLKDADKTACIPECLPLVPAGFSALSEVQGMFEEQHTLKSLPAEFAGISKFLLGNVPVARQLALTRLEHLLRKRRSELRILTICGETVDEAVDDLVSLLLRLCAKTVTSSEEKRSILTLASCIGEIGAIDPARLQLSTPAEAPRIGVDTLEIGHGELSQAPWNIDVADMSLHLLENYVVKGLKSARSALEQDRFGVAIQGLLRGLGKAYRPAVRKTRRRPRDSAGRASEHSQFDEEDDNASSGAMPDELVSALSGRGIYENVAPYWSTKYEFIDRVSKKPPFFKYGLSFERWIGLWCRYLIARVGGPFKDVFRACTGVVRYSPDIGLFLLPYLILDIWVFNDDKVSFEIGVIRREMMGVLERTRRNSRDGTSTVMAQAIFRILDVLWSWVHLTGEGASSAKRRPLERFGEPGFKSDWPKGRMHVRDQSMNCIGKLALAKAAYICSAYSRALKYYEMHVRDERLSSMKHFTTASDSGNSELDWSDGVNGQLPKLTQEEIAFLHCTLVQMDEPDALVGLQSARRFAKLSPREREHVAELAHQGSWDEALGLYEASLHSKMIEKSSHGLVLPPRMKWSTEQERPAVEIVEHDYQDSVTPLEAHHGVLTSLLNLGHTEAALQNYKGFALKSATMAVSSLPVAMEAAWQLQKWDDLELLLTSCQASGGAKEATKGSASLVDPRIFSSWATHDRIKVLFSKTVLSLARWTNCLRNGGRGTTLLESFREHLDETRMFVMQSLSAAAMESYERSYPLMLSLHMLREVETGQETILRVHREPSRTYSEFSDLHRRFELTRPSLAIRAPLLALRRTILDLSGRHGQMCESARTSTLTQAKIARSQRNFRVAQQELRWAQQLGLPVDELHLKEAKVLHAQGRVFDGLMHLAGSGFGVQIDVSKLRMQYGLTSKGAPEKSEDHQQGGLNSSEVFERNRAAKKLLYSTEWLTEAGLKHGNEVLERFDLAIEMQPTWPKAYFALGRYYDLLLKARRRELASQTNSSNVTETPLECKLAGDLTLHEFVTAAMSNYARGLEVGGGGTLKSKQLFQALPRLLTLWFEFSSLAETVASVKPKTKNRYEAREARERRELSVALRERCNGVITESVPRIEAHLWYAAQAQLLSRVTHSSEDVEQIVVKILIKILKEHTPQAIWTVGALANSEHDERKIQGSRVVQAAARLLKNIGGSRTQDVQALRECQSFFRGLIKLASYIPSEVGNMSASIGAGVRLQNFIVPTKSALSVQFASHSGRHGTDAIYEPFLDHAPRIRRFLPAVDVMRSKAKPKRIFCETSDGMEVKFLCKREEKGDLRKDSSLMEWCVVVNRLLTQDAEAAKRKLRLRTYAVICLNEECGLLEWVENTSCLKVQIEEAYKSQLNFRVPPFSSMRPVAEKLQQKHFHNRKALARAFRSEIFPKFPPVFHKWFLDQFHEPGRWLEARTRYTRAAGLWSAIGHCVGLGDRHGENILICLKTAELINVDFDCILDKGLQLKVPEVVPFRLTANMVDAMGLFGAAGVFRNVMTIVLKILREHRETLLNVLEPFLRDPTVAWQRQGRAQSEIAEAPLASEPGRLHEDAARALRTVDERLRGIYNLGPVSHGPGSNSQTDEADSADRVPLSVPGQVDRLIKEATDTENLSRMFVGWAAWM